MPNTLPLTPERRVPLPTRAQIQGARAMLGWSMRQLAKAARVSVSTIKRMEGGEPRSLSFDIQSSVRAALEDAGVRFLADGGHGEGVWLTPPACQPGPDG